MNTSVVIPVYNGEKFLAEAAGSVHAQTRSDWELIIVDDGSVDDTAGVAEQMAARDPRIRLLRQANAGVSAARNAGVAQARGDFVSFLDVDDLWEPDALDTLTRSLEPRPDASAAYGLGRHLDAQGHAVEIGRLEAYQRARHAVVNHRLVKWPEDQPTTFEVQVLQNHVCTVGTVLFRREAVAKAGLFDPAIAYLEDWDLLLRVCRVAPMIFVDHLVLGKRSHDGNVSNNWDGLMDGLRQVRGKMLRELRDDPERQLVAILGQRYMHRLNGRKELAWAASCLQVGRVPRVVKHLLRAALFTARELATAGRTLMHPGWTPQR